MPDAYFIQVKAPGVDSHATGLAWPISLSGHEDLHGNAGRGASQKCC